MNTERKDLHMLVRIEDFKTLLGIDDREDKICQFCLESSTLSIEQYCKRQLLKKKYFEKIEYYEDLLLPMREYPVSNILAVFMYGNGEILEPEFYATVPDCSSDYDMPFSLSLSPAIKRFLALNSIKVVYWAGYASDRIPADLASACLELAAWNMNRYKGRRIGMTGNVRKGGDGFELSIPSQVRQLLEPYKRRVI